MILPADKGNVTVVMDKTDYQRKMQVLLEEGSYRPRRGDPTSKLEKEVNKKLKELWTQGEIDKETYDRLRSSFCSTPQMYGLPKIHKPGIPLRPIVSSIGSATYYLAKELTSIISPLVGNTNSYVKDSGDFVQKIKRIQVNDDTLLVSFDVVQLFTKVPIEETLTVIENKLSGLPTQLTPLRAETVINLLHLCLTSMYFMWNGQIPHAWKFSRY